MTIVQNYGTPVVREMEQAIPLLNAGNSLY